MASSRSTFRIVYSSGETSQCRSIWSLSPVVDWHSGFPFSLLDENQNFFGPRNEGGRFPQLLTFDLLVMKALKFRFRGKEYKGRAGFTVFNITNHWNPRDVQNNIASEQFGTFYNSPGRSVRLKFEFVKY